MATLDAKQAESTATELTATLATKLAELRKAQDAIIVQAEECRQIELRLHAYELVAKELAG